jgi:predicted O-methyltransferase YrrM
LPIERIRKANVEDAMSTRESAGNASPKAAAGFVEEGTAFLELAGVQDAASDNARTGEPATLPSPSRLTENAFAFQRTAAVRAAVGLDLFTAIGEGHDTPTTLAERCGAADRGVRILCDLLVALGLLDRADGRYVAAPDAATYLDRRSPAFIGDALDFAASETMIKAVLSDPVTVVRNGGTILDPAEHSVAPDQTDWRTYARAVAPMMARSAVFLADLVTSHGGAIRRILDIAAGPGQNGIALARRLPDAEVTAIDWPSVLEIARENAQAAGLGERWHALPGNALETEFGGPYDVVLVARFLHLLGPQERETLLRRLYAALAPGGRIVALQIMLNDDHVSPRFAATMNFNVLATTPSGQVPTAGELDALLVDAGFDHLEWHDLPGSDERVVIGWKQR